MSDKKYAVYSAQQAQKHGTVFWRGVNGEDIELSQIADTPDGSDCHFSDKEMRGEVVEYVRKGRKGTNERQYFTEVPR